MNGNTFLQLTPDPLLLLTITYLMGSALSAIVAFAFEPLRSRWARRHGADRPG